MAFTRTELNGGFRLGQYLIEPRQNRIVRHDGEVRLEPRVMDVLVCLAEHAGEVVSRDALNEQVWGKLVVTDQAVTNCISELRHHLGDDRSTNRVIETIPKRGYRLVVPVQRAHVEPEQAGPSQSPFQAQLQSPSPAPPQAAVAPRRLRFAIAVALLAVLALGALWWWRTDSEPALTSVAVLRFENAANDETLEYLSLALPDEMATLLTKSRGVTVRPFGYVDDENALASARDRRVDHIVAGRFYL
jgi:DNA-binding winged helix-turn-helix (wHTH) protein